MKKNTSHAGNDLTELRRELDAAQALDRELKLGTPAYKANRARIGELTAEIHQADSAHSIANPPQFTCENYANWPDSFEQMADDRRRNPYEHAARLEKAHKMANVLVACGAAEHVDGLAEMVADEQNSIWWNAAQLADVAPPSHATRLMIVADLLSRTPLEVRP